MEATSIIPTLGRESLADAQKTLASQSIVLTKLGPEDTLIKIKEAVNEAKTETVVVADDDAKFPDDWIMQLGKVYGEGVAYVCGPCLPLLDKDSSDAERCIAEVTTSFIGTSNMSYRWKKGGRVKNADETNLISNGLYNREVFAKILNEEYDRIPPAAWETYVFTRFRQMGYKTLFNPSAFFYHRERPNIFSFAKQIFRSGMGRANYFKQFPKQMIPKFYILFPSLFVIYLLAFFGLAYLNLPISGIPLVAYVALIMLVSYGLNRNKSKWTAFYYIVMHLSYGLGMIVGIVVNKRTWT